MIDPASLDLSVLPWVPLNATSSFPAQPGIYFAIDSQNVVQYIGMSKDVRGRWKQHHRYEELEAIGSVKIAYLFIDSIELLPEIESALIEWFNPPLNKIGKPTQRLTTEIEPKDPIVAQESEVRRRKWLAHLITAIQGDRPNRDFGALFGVTGTTIAAWRSGKTDPETLSYSRWRQIAVATNRSVEDLAEECYGTREDFAVDSHELQKAIEQASIDQIPALLQTIAAKFSNF